MKRCANVKMCPDGYRDADEEKVFRVKPSFESSYMEFKIIKQASLKKIKCTGNTRHFVNGELLVEVAALQIAQYEGDEGFYLFYLGENGEV